METRADVYVVIFGMVAPNHTMNHVSAVVRFDHMPSLVEMRDALADHARPGRSDSREYTVVTNFQIVTREMANALRASPPAPPRPTPSLPFQVQRQDGQDCAIL